MPRSGRSGCTILPKCNKPWPTWWIASSVARAETQTFGLRVVTVDHPNWRARAQRLLKPISVQTPGVQAWLIEKEDAARLMAELRRRTDFREHSSPHLMVNNGQSSVVSATRDRSYVRGAVSRPDVWPGFEPETAVIDEGFSLEFTPLLSVDTKVIDATIKCDIDQIEKMIPVMLDVPTVVAPRQRTRIEVPQIAHFRFHERFRWPAEQVLLVGMGMVAVPVPSEGKPLVAGIPLPLKSFAAPRADLLVFIQSKAEAPPVAPRHSGHVVGGNHVSRQVLIDLRGSTLVEGHRAVEPYRALPRGGLHRRRRGAKRYGVFRRTDRDGLPRGRRED